MSLAGADLLAQADRLLFEAEQHPALAHAAALAALQALLMSRGVTPQGDSIGALLAQASESDEGLRHFQAAAEALDRDPLDVAALESARLFVDTARTRLANSEPA